MSVTSFGKVIPVTGQDLGFPGNISRIGERVIAARQALATRSTNQIYFGAASVIIPDATGGTYQSVADFIAQAPANAASVATQFAGAAVREVKTMLTYPEGQTPGIDLTGFYAPGKIAEILERGSMTVSVTSGAATSQAPVFIRTATNAGAAGSAVGDFVAEADAAVATTMGTTSGSANITVASGTGIIVGQFATGVGIPANTVVIAVNGTTVTLSQNATATAASGVAVSFQGTVQAPNTVFRTGYMDENNFAEITIKVRNAA